MTYDHVTILAMPRNLKKFLDLKIIWNPPQKTGVSKKRSLVNVNSVDNVDHVDNVGNGDNVDNVVTVDNFDIVGNVTLLKILIFLAM